MSQNNYHTDEYGLHNVKCCWSTSVKCEPKNVPLLHFIYF